jgi:S1-C subfamily serine protease
VNEVNVDETHSLSTLLGRYGVSQKVTLTVVRDGKTQTITAVLDAAPQA